MNYHKLLIIKNSNNMEALRTHNVAEVQLTYKTKVKRSEMNTVRTAEDIVRIMRAIYNADTIEYREEFYLLLINRSNKVLGTIKISEGGLSGTVADIRMIYQSALLSNASAIICIHNHPSGNIQPSGEDETLTRRIKEAGLLLDIKLLDHIILSAEHFYSFSNEGLI